MNGKQAKQIRRTTNAKSKAMIDAIMQKGKDDATGYWNYLCEDTFWNRVRMAFDLIKGRKQ